MLDARRSAARQARRDTRRDHEPARDDAALGARDREPVHRRSSGRTGAPPTLPRARRRADPREDRARARSVLLGDEARVAAARARRRDGLAFGTVDSWLVWKLTGGAVHVTDLTNASRTLLSRSRRSTGTTSCSSCSASTARCCRASSARPTSSARRSCSAATVPIRGIAGDQQAALFGQGCHARRRSQGDLRHRQLRARAHRRRLRAPPPHGLLKTAAADGYALEGAVLVAARRSSGCATGSGSIADAAESEALADSVESTGGVVLRAGADRARLAVLGPGRARARHRAHARHDARAPRAGGARGDRAPGRRRRRRAAAAAGGAPRRRRRDRERLPMQFQADLLGIAVEVAAERETTALGAAALAAGRDVRVSARGRLRAALARRAERVSGDRLGGLEPVALTRSS